MLFTYCGVINYCCIKAPNLGQKILEAIFVQPTLKFDRKLATFLTIFWPVLRSILLTTRVVLFLAYITPKRTLPAQPTGV